MTTGVLVLAGGASWEAGVLAACAGAGLTVVSRCVDVVDLMAAATLRRAGVAVVAADLGRLDADAVRFLLRHDVRVLGVGGADQLDRIQRLGAVPVREDADEIVRALIDLDAAGRAEAGSGPDEPAPTLPGPRGRVIAVSGPAGAPGRSTVALTIAAEVAAVGRRTVLVDADPDGGSIAQQVGILDEASGLLAVARRVNVGGLDATTFAASCRRASPGLDVLTGLPRGDRRIEVRPGVLEVVLETAAAIADVVVDAGSGIEDSLHERDRMSVDVLAAADEIVVVGAVDPIGLARLARALAEVGERVPGTPVRVVLNRTRPSLRWDRAELIELVGRHLRPVSVHLVPEDRETLDRALVSGRTLVELGGSQLRSALMEVTRSVFPDAFEHSRAHRGRRRLVQEPKSR